MKKRRDARLQLRIALEEKRALQKLAEARDMPASLIVRQLLRQAIAQAGEGTR